jgi:hypothetical protein
LVAHFPQRLAVVFIFTTSKPMEMAITSFIRPVAG